MSFKFCGWYRKERVYLSQALNLTDEEHRLLRNDFIKWVQKGYNFLDSEDLRILDPTVHHKWIKKMRKLLKKDLKKGRVYPSGYYIEQRINLPRGGAATVKDAAKLNLTRDQVLFWLGRNPQEECMLVKLAGFRDPEDLQLVRPVARQMDVGDLAFFAELHDRDTLLKSTNDLFVRYRTRVQNANCLTMAKKKIDVMSASQLHFWFDGHERTYSRFYDDRYMERVEKKLSMLEHGASCAKAAFQIIDRLNQDQLAYWAAETRAAVFEIALLIKTGQAPDEKQATEMVYFDRMYRAGPNAEERIQGRDAQEVWQEALTPTRLDSEEWLTWGDDVLRLVCEHYPVEDNDFYPLSLLLSTPHDSSKEAAVLHAFQTLVSLCNENPRTDWIGVLAKNESHEWMAALVNWRPPVLPAYSS